MVCVHLLKTKYFHTLRNLSSNSGKSGPQLPESTQQTGELFPNIDLKSLG